MVFRNSHPPKKTDVGTSWPLRRVWHLVFHESGFLFFDPTLAKQFSPWNFCFVFFGHPCLRSSDYMSVKIWPPMLPICQDWTCLGGQVLRCFCWQSGACRVTLPQTTLCFCWSCFGWYVIEKQKTSKPWICVLFVVGIFLIFWQLTTFAHGDFSQRYFGAWNLKACRDDSGIHIVTPKTDLHSSKLTEKHRWFHWSFLLGLVHPFLKRCVNAVRFRDDTGDWLFVFAWCAAFQPSR